MRIRAIFLFLSIMAILLVGCGGGKKSSINPSNEATALSAPSGLKAELSGDLFGLLLTWVPPKEPYDGFEIEAWAGQPPFQKIHTELIPPSNSVTLDFSDTVPDATPFMFRIRAVRGDLYSGYSSETPYRFGVRAPNNFKVSFDSLTKSGLLSWDPSAYPGSKPKLIRELPLPKQVLVSGNSEITSYVDAGLQEGVTYSYHIAFENQGIESNYVGGAFTIPVPAPENFQVSLKGNDAQLSWVNKSLGASKIIVQRSAGNSGFVDIATLSPSATNYVDSDLKLGFYSYQVLAVVDAWNLGRSNSLKIRTLENPLDLKFKEEQLQMGIAQEALCNAQGFWRLLEGFAPPYHLNRQTQNGWSPQSLNYFLGTPGLLLDSAGEPHSFHFDEPNADGRKNLHHTWNDGQEWKTEVVRSLKPAYSSSYPYFQSASGAGHQLAALWTEETAISGSTQLRFVWGKNGAWQDENVPIDPTSFFGMGGFRMDPENRAYVWCKDWQGIRILVRAPEGGWQVMPFNPVLESGDRLVDIVQLTPQGSSNLHVVYTTSKWTGSDSKISFHIQTLQNGIWGAPETLPMSADMLLAGQVSSRMLIIEESVAGFIVWERLSPRTWRPTLLPCHPVINQKKWPMLSSEDNLCFLQFLDYAGNGKASYRLLTELPHSSTKAPSIN